MLRHHSISKIAASQARGHNKEPHISICFRKKKKTTSSVFESNDESQKQTREELCLKGEEERQY